MTDQKSNALDDDTSARRFDDGPPSVFLPRTVSSVAAQAPLPRGRVPAPVSEELTTVLHRWGRD